MDINNPGTNSSGSGSFISVEKFTSIVKPLFVNEEEKFIKVRVIV